MQKAEGTAEVTQLVSAGADASQSWMTGGPYLVARKIRMTIETWARSSLRERERVVGRTKGEAAPLSGGTEFTELDLEKTTADDVPIVDRASVGQEGDAGLIRMQKRHVDVAVARMAAPHPGSPGCTMRGSRASSDPPPRRALHQ